MRFTIARRALVAAAAITLLTVPSVAAESVDADGDAVTVGFQSSIDLGTVAPGEDVPYYVYFVVTCSGTNHVDATQSIRLSPGTRSVPSGGGFSVGTLTFGMPSGWPADGATCPTDLDPYVAGPLYVIVTAPMTEGLDYHYRFSWNRAVTPASANDSGVFSGTNPTIDFVLDVATPPPAEPAAVASTAGRLDGRRQHDRWRDRGLHGRRHRPRRRRGSDVDVQPGCWGAPAARNDNRRLHRDR